MDNNLTSNEIDILIENLTHFENKCDHNSYSYLKNCLDELIIPFPAISIIKGKLLFRARRHSKGEEYFINISDISYRPDIFNIHEFGRANEPCQSIFYCSDQHEIALFETSITSRKNADVEIDTLTTGIWEVNEEIIVGCLLNHPSFTAINKTQNFLDQNAKKIVEEFRDQNTDNLLRFHEFISKEFTKKTAEDSSKYLISCAFANYIYSNIGYHTTLKENLGLDGIIYPSVVYPKFGINLALKTDTITSNKLSLIGARKSSIVRKSHNQYLEENIVETRSIDKINKRITWPKVSG